MKQNAYYYLHLFIISLLALIVVSCQGRSQESLPTTTSTASVPTQIPPTLDPSIDPRTATVAALLTQSARISTSTPASPAVGSMPTSTMLPLPAPTGAPIFELQWTIETGDIVALGAAENGTLVGFTSTSGRSGLKHVSISPQGEIIQILDAPEAYDCVYQLSSGAPHASRTSLRHFRVTPDGTILCPRHKDIFITSPSGHTSVINFGGDSSVNVTGQDTFYIRIDRTISFYDSSGSLLNEINLGEGDTIIGKNVYWETNGILILQQDNFEYSTHDGRLVHFDIPAGLDTKSKDFSYTITPWDDLYLYYVTYDAIGNRIGDFIMRVRPDGSMQPIGSDIWRTYRNAQSLMQVITYQPHHGQIYSLFAGRLTELTPNLDTVRSFQLSAEFNDFKSAFMGDDGALYIWKNQKLSKYSLTTGLY